MRKKLLLGMTLIFALGILFLNAPTVHAGTYTVGNKTITFEKFRHEEIDEEIVYVLDYKNNQDGMILETKSSKFYHISLDGTIIEEKTEDEVDELYTDGLLVDIYVGYIATSPEEFSQELPEITLVEGTGDNAMRYAVKIGEEIVSDYEYYASSATIHESTGNLMVKIVENKQTNLLDVWLNTKTSSKVVTISDSDYIGASDDLAFLTIYKYSDEGNDQFLVFDWFGNEIKTLEVPSDSDVYVNKIEMCGQEFLQVDINDKDNGKVEVYDLNGNKVLEAENNTWFYAFQFGMLEYHSDEASTSKVKEIKNNITISDTIEFDGEADGWIDLCATTAKLTNTSDDYLAPGKYYFVTSEANDVYEMTISYTMLEGANSSVDKTNAENLTVKTDGDLEKLEGIYVDNEKLDENNYTLTEGSTIVTLKNEYLKTLETGEYTLKVKYLDGEVETTFTVTETPNEDEPQKPGETPEDEDSGKGDEGKDDTKAPTILPDTGIEKCIMIISILAIIVMVSYIKVKKLKEIK